MYHIGYWAYVIEIWVYVTEIYKLFINSLKENQKYYLAKYTINKLMDIHDKSIDDEEDYRDAGSEVVDLTTNVSSDEVIDLTTRQLTLLDCWGDRIIIKRSAPHLTLTKRSTKRPRMLHFSCLCVPKYEPALKVVVETVSEYVKVTNFQYTLRQFGFSFK